jgi:TIR domain/Effector-associated domain 1
MEKPCRVFCCYARRDQEFLLDLKTHLKSLEREGLITVKADIDISPGTEWEPTINHHLETADIILLLISPDFIASDYCFDKEMQEAIARHEQGTARVVPVIVRPASWHSLPFGKLQALPKDAQPISISQDRDTALLSVTKGIRLVVRELIANTPVAKWKARDDTFPDVSEGIPTGAQGRLRTDMPFNRNEELWKALMNAFPQIADLQRLMYFNFNINLYEIVRTNNLSECILDLIMWGNSRGKTEDLVRAALKERPDNVSLRDCASKMGLIALDPNEGNQSWPLVRENPLPSSGSAKFNINNNGPVQSQVIADHAHVVQNFNGNQKDGKHSLEKGARALWNGDYAAAKRELRVAVEEIDGENQSREASQANYFFVLALLDGELPRTQVDAVMQSIERAMNNAVRLYPCASYYRVFARIQWDFFQYNGLQHRLNEVQILESKGASFPRRTDDEENEKYFRHCQPRLPI